VGYGPGSRLGAAYGIVFASQQSTLDVAYLVIPNDGTVVVNGAVATSNGFGGSWISSARAWNGGGTQWNSAPANTNWRMWGNAVAFNEGDDVQFGDAGLSGGGVVRVAPEGVAPGHVTIQHNTGEYVFTGGRVDGSGNLRLRTLGSVTFNGPVSVAGEASFLAESVWINDTFDASSVSVDNCKVLGGTGTITGGLTGGTTIVPGGFGSIGSLTVDSMSFGHGVFELDAANSDRLVITQPGGLSSEHGAWCSLKRLSNVSAGTYTLINYSGPTPANLERLTVEPAGIGGFAASLVNNSANHSIDLVLDSGPHWQLDSNGTWSDASAWSTVVPRGTGMPVTLGPAITAPRTILVDDRVVIGSLRIDSPISYTLVPGWAVELVLNTADLDTPSIDVRRGSHTISPTVVLERDLTINVAQPTSVLTMAGRVWGPSRALTKTGPGTLKLTWLPWALEVNHLFVDAGTVMLNGEAHGGFSVSAGATLAGSGTIEQPVLLDPGARLSPGEDPGTRATLSMAGLSLNDALLDFDLTSSGADRIEITGADRFLLEGISTVNLTFTGGIARGAYPLIDYNGTPVPDLGHLVLGLVPPIDVPLLLAYNPGNTSIDLIVGDSFTPEPTSALLMAAACSIMARSRRSHQRRHPASIPAT
jgi:hypothetical protein